MDIKPYVVFRDELIRDMQKNPHIFQPTEEGKKVAQGFRDEEGRLYKLDESENNIGKSK